MQRRRRKKQPTGTKQQPIKALYKASAKANTLFQLQSMFPPLTETRFYRHLGVFAFDCNTTYNLLLYLLPSTCNFTFLPLTDCLECAHASNKSSFQRVDLVFSFLFCISFRFACPGGRNVCDTSTTAQTKERV